MRVYSADKLEKINVNVNGKEIETQVEPRKLLSDFLREDCGLKGTHVGCEHGVCGSCTVLLNGQLVRSCLTFSVQVDGSDVETIEGLSREKIGKILIEEFTNNHALQCGFCTSGIFVSTYILIQERHTISREEISDFMSGHICRCTGYTGIINAVESAFKRIK